MRVKIVLSIFRILLSGSSLGTFFYSQSIPTAQIFKDAHNLPRILWGIPSFSHFSFSVFLGNIIVLAIWLIYSYGLSKASHERFARAALLDSYSYLPLSLLLLFLIQFISFLTSHLEGLLLLSQWNGNILLLLSVLGVLYLKHCAYSAIAPLDSLTLFSQHKTAKPSWTLKLGLFLFAFFVYAFVGFRVTQTLGPGGDEPHYLLMSHSLLHDRDLAISNNYKQQDYKTFYSGVLDPHVSIARDGTRYSIHPIGAPVLLAPFYAVSGYRGALIGMNLMAATLSLVLFLIAYSLSQQFWISLLLWFIVSFTPPLLLYSSAIYPEIPAALFIASAYYIISTRKYRRKEGLILFSFLLAWLPWLQSRTILAAIMLLCYHLFLIWEDDRIVFWRKPHRPAVILPTSSLVLSGLLMGAGNFAYFGSPFPNAPYRSVGVMKVFSWDIFLKEGSLGLLFDQEAGLLIYAPYFIFCAIGVLCLWKKKRSTLLFCLLIIAGIYIPCAGFTLKWRGALSPVARYMVAQLPFWYILLTVGVTYSLRHTFSRYIFLFSAILSMVWSGLFLCDPVLAVMRNNGINRFFERESFFLSLAHYFPSFTPHASGNFLLAGFLTTSILLFAYGVYSASSKSGSLSAGVKEPADNCRRQSLRVLFGSYGLLVVSCGAWTCFTIIPESSPDVSMRQRAGLYRLFSQLNYETILSNHPQIHDTENIRFTLFAHPKIAHNTRTGPRFIVSGPKKTFLQGHYTASFDLAFSGQVSENTPIARLEVVTRNGTHLFNSRTLFGRDFPISGQHERFTFPFELCLNIEDVETRVFFHNQGSLEVSQIFIEINEQELYYHAGIQAMRESKFSLAKNLLTKIDHSRYPRSLYYLALIEQHNERWTESLQFLQAIIQHIPDFADAYYRQGLAYNHLQQTEEAERLFRTALSILPKHLESLKALQKLYVQQNRPEQAQELREKIQKLYPPQYLQYANFDNQIEFLGYSLERLSDEIMKIEYYWRALDLMPADYAFFVHIKDESGQTIQQDHEPARWLAQTGQQEKYPTSHWKTGELVRERYDIEFSGTAPTILLGVWEPVFTKQHLAIRDSFDRKPHYSIELKEHLANNESQIQ